jgi:uncharacterized membrane protein YhhN
VSWQLPLWRFDLKSEGAKMGDEVKSGGTLAKATLVAAMIVGATYLFGMNADLQPTALLAWKGAGVWLLAIYAAISARNRDGWMITLVMAMGALGDVLVERDQTQGAAAFIVGHVVATLLYLSHRRPALTMSQKWLAIVVVPAVMLIGWGLTRDPSILLYSLFLSIMAASAWISRFPRYRTGIGAMLFVVSDVLIFARMDLLAEAGWVTPAIWALYFAGQVLIVIGVTQRLSAASEDPPLSFAR